MILESKAYFIIMKTSQDYFEEIQQELHNISHQSEEGELSNLDALIKMRNAKKEAEIILEIVKEFENNRFNEIVNEADKYKGSYLGFEIKSVSGRQTYSYKSIPLINEIDEKKKQLEDKFKNAFIGFQKGTVQTTEVDGVRYWIDEDSELQLFPELSIGKSYLLVKEKK